MNLQTNLSALLCAACLALLGARSFSRDRLQEDPAPAATAALHDRAFWEGIVASGHAVPEGADGFALLQELNGFLASPDPELRDGFGYGISTQWVYVQDLFSPEQLRSQVIRLRAMLQVDIGKSRDQSVLARSFAALNLSVLVATDLKRPFLGEEDFEALLDSAIVYLESERDLRGWDSELGWLHSCAHTADLFKFLGRHPRLGPGPARKRVYGAFARKLTNPSGLVLNHGEDERMAVALISYLRRDDFDHDEFQVFFRALEESQPRSEEEGFDPIGHAASTNAKHMLRALLQLLRSDAIEDNLRADALEKDVLGYLNGEH